MTRKIRPPIAPARGHSNAVLGRVLLQIAADHGAFQPGRRSRFLAESGFTCQLWTSIAAGHCSMTVCDLVNYLHALNIPPGAVMETIFNAYHNRKENHD